MHDATLTAPATSRPPMTTPPGMVACEIETSIDEDARQSRPTTFGRRRWVVVIGVAIAMVLSLVVAVVAFVDRNGQTVQPAQSQADGEGDSTQPQDHSTAPQPAPQPATAPQPQDDSVQVWSEAQVTLSSGVMYEIIEQIPHDAQAFTQGLTFADGKLFESTGLYGQSTIRQLDPVSATVLVSLPLGAEYFGEGLAHVDGKLVQITWKETTAFVWNASDLTIPPVEYSYGTTGNNEGWGITYWEKNHELVVSDGSENLIFWDPNTMETLRTLAVIRQNGQRALHMNELEFWRGRVLANVWYEDVLLVIHPETGVVEKEYDFNNLWPKSERRNHGADVLNGISITDDPDILLVTGKLWNRMYRIKLLP